MSAERFEALYRAHLRDVYRYVARRHAGQDLDDLTAEVFTIAWRKLAEIPVGFELPWLYRTAWLVVANAHRKPVEIPSQIDLSEHEPDVADAVIAQEQMLRVWQLLPQRDREILRLAAWEGLSGPQLASALGISAGGAAAALSRARANLRSALATET